MFCFFNYCIIVYCFNCYFFYLSGYVYIFGLRISDKISVATINRCVLTWFSGAFNSRKHRTFTVQFIIGAYVLFTLFRKVKTHMFRQVSFYLLANIIIIMFIMINPYVAGIQSMIVHLIVIFSLDGKSL